MAAKSAKERRQAALKAWATRRLMAGQGAPAARKKQVQKVVRAAKEAEIETEELDLAETEFDLEAKAEADERVRMLRRETAMLTRKLSVSKASTDIIISELYSLFKDRPIIVDIPERPENASSAKRVEIPVFCVGDTHFGYHAPFGRFQYTVEIGTKRMHMAVDKFLDTVRDRRTSARIEECRLYVIGDMVEGENMRQGHGHHIEGPVIQQACVWAPEALSAVVIKLLGEFSKLKIVAVPGNHGRNGPPKTDAHPATNWDRVCYQTTRHMVDNALLQSKPERISDITWDLPTERHELADGDDWFAIDYVFDWCNCLLHGEDLKGKGWGGIPFYGIERMVRRYADIVADPIDYMYMGHIHVDAKIPSNFREVFVNGAIQSSSTYARKQLVSATSPSQAAVFYTEDNGPISHHKFYLDERVPHGTRTMLALERRDEARA